MEMQLVYGSVAMLAEDNEAATAVLADAAQLSEQLGEDALQGWAHFYLGLIKGLSGEIDAARAHLEASRAVHGSLGIGVGWARATAVLGVTFLVEGDPVRAPRLVAQARGLGGPARAAGSMTPSRWGSATADRQPSPRAV